LEVVIFDVRILGYDPGTAFTGYALVGGSIGKSVELLPDFGVIKTTKADGDVRTRIDMIGNQVRDHIQELRPTHVAIEDFVEQGVDAGTTYKDMATLIEHLRMVCRYNGIEATIYPNAEWKKIAVGTKGLNKKQIQHFVSHRLPKASELLTGRTATHVWDSAGIAYAKYIELNGGNYNGQNQRNKSNIELPQRSGHTRISRRI
jgi:Holliday junction resolvasome RuvABC endonuclease subunit